MKRSRVIILAALLATAWTAEAAAGWFGGRKDKDERQPLVHRYTGTVQRYLLAGELREAGSGHWLLDDEALVLASGCLVLDEAGRPGSLRPGSRVLVLGRRCGGTVVARGIRVSPDRVAASDADRERYGIRWSEANADVGEGTVTGVE